MSLSVKLKRDWFGPDGSLYRAVDSPVTISENFREILPSSAVVLEEILPAEIIPEEDEE